MLPTRNLSHWQNHTQAENEKGYKIIFQADRIQNEAEVAILLSDKAEIPSKLVRRDKPGCSTEEWSIIAGFLVSNE